MSMDNYEPDRDYGDENAYTQRPYQSALCERCGQNAALPDQDWCESCVTEHELAFEVGLDRAEGFA